jgi:hypothetical protein
MIKKFFIGSFLIILLINCSAQINFESSTLKDIFDRLPELVKNNILEICKKNKEIHIDSLIPCDNKILTVSFDNSVLTNLGLWLRGMYNLGTYEQKVISFIERTLLRMSFDNTIPEMQCTAEALQINFLFHDKKLIFTTLSGFNELLDSINNSSRFTLSRDSYYIVAEWGNNSRNIQMVFPNNYQLITGKNKKELDEELLCKLGGINIEKFPGDTTKTFENSNDSLPVLVSKGSSYMNLFTSDVYYKYKGNDSILVFDEGLISNSISNLFLIKGLMGKRSIQLNQKLYGRRSAAFNLNLQQFINFFENDFHRFIGIESSKPDSIEGTVIFSHKYFNFIHLLHFKTNTHEIFCNNGNIQADLFTNIPMHNVLNTFMDFKPEATKQKFEVIINKP